MADTEEAVGEIAARLRAAVEVPDEGLLAGLLAEDVRWGGAEETPQTCHSRADVLRWYRALRDAGVRARVTETVTAPEAIVLALVITQPPAPVASPPRGVIYQVFRVRSGLISDICGAPARSQALGLAGLAPGQAGIGA